MRSATESAAKDPTPKEEDPPVPPVIQQEQQELTIQTLPDPIEPAAEQLEAAPVDEKFTRLPLRLIGIVFDTYIILEYQDRMLLCDQHAVHERLLYERMMKACAGDTSAQGLLTPVLVRLTHREYEAFLENGEALRAAGFDAADFGDLTVQLRAVPMVLGVARTTECLRDALDDLSESGQISTQKRTDRIIQMACKHAVKGGEKIPVDASSKMPDDYMDSIEPFDYADLKPFSTAYLPGFMADKYDVSVEDSRERADTRCAGSLLSALERTVSGYTTCNETSRDIHLKRGKVHYALLPVWILNTRWEGKDFLFAMNGQTGKLVGNLPVSTKRVIGLFAAIAASLIAISVTALLLLAR